MKKKLPAKRNQSDYAIGYGRPPKATRFKKGVSGNERGRPKGAKNVVTLFRETMAQKVPIVENGRRRKVAKFEAALIQLANKAATGDAKAFQAIMNILRELGDLKLPDPSQGPKERTFTLKVFSRDITGKLFRVKPGTNERIDDDEDE